MLRRPFVIFKPLGLRLQLDVAMRAVAEPVPIRVTLHPGELFQPLVPESSGLVVIFLPD